MRHELMIGGLAISLALGACGKQASEPAPAAVSAPVKGSDHGTHEQAAPHAHKAPHGGQVATAGKYHIEGVASKVGLMVFLLDENEATLPIDGVKGTVLLSGGGKPPVESTFEAMGNHLHAMVTLEGEWVAVVSLDVKGETLSARFTGTGPQNGAAHAHGKGHGDDEHGGHDHDHAAGAQPMGMQLSDKAMAHVGAAGTVTPGTPARLTFVYHSAEPHAPLSDFEVVHERKLHVFVVSEDMSFFDHVHPEPGDIGSGVWTLDQAFPAPGKYLIYSDFKSTKLGPIVTVTPFEVPGSAPAPKPLVVDGELKQTFGDLTVTLKTTPSPLAASDAMLEYTIADSAGQPVTDLEPYLGAFGHLFILNEDLTSMAHAHPKGAEPTPEMRGGPVVSFHAVLPKAGKYKLWAQVQRAGKVITTAFTVAVP